MWQRSNTLPAPLAARVRSLNLTHQHARSTHVNSRRSTSAAASSTAPQGRMAPRPSSALRSAPARARLVSIARRQRSPLSTARRARMACQTSPAPPSRAASVRAPPKQRLALSCTRPILSHIRPVLSLSLSRDSAVCCPAHSACTPGTYNPDVSRVGTGCLACPAGKLSQGLNAISCEASRQRPERVTLLRCA